MNWPNVVLLACVAAACFFIAAAILDTRKFRPCPQCQGTGRILRASQEEEK